MKTLVKIFSFFTFFSILLAFAGIVGITIYHYNNPELTNMQIFIKFAWYIIPTFLMLVFSYLLGKSIKNKIKN
jgi:hypothetical protein